MRWWAFFILGSPYCDKLVKVEAQPPTKSEYEQVTEHCIVNSRRIGTRQAIVSTECRHVIEIYERRDGARYTKETDECETDRYMQGPCT